MKIGAVLVTFNRIKKLKHALQCYSEQTFKPVFLIVVDNCSTDGTYEFLESWAETDEAFLKRVIHLPENTGGAGGFHEGMKAALEMDTDWIWIADDDAYPRTDTFAELDSFYERMDPKEKETIAAVCSAVYTNGKPVGRHRACILKTTFKIKFVPSDDEDYKKDYFSFNTLSYVGSCIRKTVLERAGLDEKDYFIYHDDAEHSLRLKKYGKFVCCTSSIVDHDGPQSSEDAINWGQYYKSRNLLLMIRTHFPFRYFMLRIVKRYITNASIFSNKDRQLKKLYKAAYFDALCGRKGVHPVYHPGWRPKKP